MDTYITQLIVVIILLLLASTYNIVRLTNNEYPALLVDFIFHAVVIFAGLFLFFYFYVKNLIREDTDITFEGLLNNNGLPLESIKQVIEKNADPAQIEQIKIILKNNIDDKSINTVVGDSNDKNTSVLNTGLSITIVMFVIMVLITVCLKFYSKYEINLGRIVLFNLYAFIITMSIEYLILIYITNNQIQPLSQYDFIQTVFDRFKYNLDQQF